MNQPQSKKMNFNKSILGGWNVFTIEGEMSFPQIEHIDRLSSDIKALVGQGEYKFLFDLSLVPYIDSSGLSVVILTISNALKKNTPVKICGLNEMTRMSFEVMVDFGVEYHDTIEEALAISE
jgi:anti-anti-sigma factor